MTSDSLQANGHHAGGPIAPNAYRLLWAGFAAILAAGVGFAIRGGILDNWGREYGFSGAELGVIGGAGFTGFCFGIIIGGIIADKIGYGKLVIIAFLMHVLSAVVTFGAGATPDMSQAQIYNYLFWGTFMFAIANGTLEAVANPLVATLFPHNRTHYLNILHASWPAGMVLGGVMGWILDDQYKMPWKYQLALFLVPTAIYGLMFLGQRMPRSEASEKGLSLGQMLKDVGLMGGAVVCCLLALFFKDVLGQLMGALPVLKPYAMQAPYIACGIGAVLWIGIGLLTNFSIGSFLLFVIFFTHALVGAVELGTDGWIQNITGNLLSSQEGKILFVITSLVMFCLRFCAHFIEKKIGLNPVSLLFVCAVVACVGLNMTARVTTFNAALLALIIYGFGKTFFWPTMLAVASDRFPRTGAVAISIMGGIGMMSAGLLGSAGLGYSKDYYSAQALQKADVALYEEYKNDKSSSFLGVFPEVNGLDGKKLGEVTDKLNKIKETKSTATPADLEGKDRTVMEASIEGDRKTLIADSFIPATMAVIYLLLIFYFMSIGGYKIVHIDQPDEPEAKTL
jgi:MFS family permease